MSQSSSLPGRRSVDSRTRMGLQTFVKATPFHEVFARVFPSLDELYRSFTGDGVLIVAVIAGRRVEAYLHVALTDAPEFVIVGRHSECDLRLGSDEALSLRHLIIAARRRGCEVRVRLLDLGTGAGLQTEDGQRCEGIAADGAAFVNVGQYHLFVLPTGALAPLPWANNAADTWASIPDRVYLDQRTPGTSQGQAPRVRLVDAVDRRSIATQIIDPPTALREQRPLPGDRGPHVGVLTLSAGSVSEAYDVHAIDLARGLLIGRYDRCAFGAEDDRLSRVHLLLVQDGDGDGGGQGPEVWAVDTASSNGTTARGMRIRQTQLGAGVELSLARAISLSWLRDPADAPAPIAAPAASPET